MTPATAAPALAQKSADTLRIAWRDAIPDVNPYYNSPRTGRHRPLQDHQGDGITQIDMERYNG